MTLFKKISIKGVYWIYPIYLFICYIQARAWTTQVYPGDGILIWPLRIFMLLIGLKAFVVNAHKCIPLSLFFIYNVFSFILYAFNGYPFSLYINDFVFYIIPMTFAFVGLNSDLSDNFYKYTFISIIVFCVYGLYLYSVTPAWYQNAMVRIQTSKYWLQGLDVDFSYIQERIRFGSFLLTSYATEYFGLFALPFSIVGIIKSRNKKEKSMYMIFTLIVFVSIILSMQRAAILCSVLIIITLGFYDTIHKRKAIVFYLLGGILVVLFLLNYTTSDLGLRVFERFGDINLTAFSDRQYQSENLLSVWDNYIFGNGLGTGGNEARKRGYLAATDANYTKLLVELGVFGFGLFILLVLTTCLRIYKNFKYYAVEGAFIVSVLIAMLGSNALMFDFFIPPFWFCIGRVWNTQYLNKKKLEQDFI